MVKFVEIILSFLILTLRLSIFVGPYLFVELHFYECCIKSCFNKTEEEKNPSQSSLHISPQFVRIKCLTQNQICKIFFVLSAKKTRLSAYRPLETLA